MNDGVTKNRQSNNKVGGDQANRDVNKTTNIKLYPSKDRDTLNRKLMQLREKDFQDPAFKDYIKQITHRINLINPNDQRNLKTKLTDANRADEIPEAEDLKEKFAKELTRKGLSIKAQEAYIHILCKIKTHYDGKVKPLMKINAPILDIEAQVIEIIEEIYSDLEGTMLEYDMFQIKGMLYFLTGNCHIDWKY